MTYKSLIKKFLTLTVVNIKYKLLKSCYLMKFTSIEETFEVNKTELLYDTNLLKNKLIYKDENWNYIKKLFELFWYISVSNKLINIIDNCCINTKIKYIENEWIFQSNAFNDDWIYYYLPENINENYLIQFDLIVQSVFTEFQIAIKHHSIFERYRFRIIDNEYLVFEVIKNGYFFNELFKCPLRLNLNETYRIKVVVKNNNYIFIVNEVHVMNIYEKGNLIANGGFAIIIWDFKDSSNIDLRIKDMKVLSIYN